MYRILGIMSGTSLDGLDIAQCTFNEVDGKWQYAIERAVTFPYIDEWRKKLANAENLSGLDLMFLHNEVGNYTGECINQFLKGNRDKIDFIASHGQTIFHQPQKGLTLQIGNGACIAAKTGIPVICDFRTLDVALGGQGAPLVPIGDKLLFSDYDYCLNLGGFANISYDNSSGTRLAYDICPVNIVINHLVAERGLSYDKDGAIARKGKANEKLFQDLNHLEFYNQKGPKSLGKEWVIKEILPLMHKYNLSLEDKLRTFYEHVAVQISGEVSSCQGKSVLVTGGGAHNSFLINLFRENFLADVILPDKNVIDFKEALIFAFLGLLRSQGKFNCLKSVTGARVDNVGGVIYSV